MSVRRGIAGEPGVARAAEVQLRNLEYARSQRLGSPATSRGDVSEFICISRMVGLDGREIAQPVAERLGWPLFDREVLDWMAGDDEVRRQIYRAMDERDFKWWEAAMSPWVVGRYVLDDYFHCLCDAVLSLARRGSCVFLGRGADLVLPPRMGLRVRMVASLATRVKAMAASRARTEAEAKAVITAEERSRTEFFRRHFHADADDLGRHDLVINLDRMSAAEAVEVVVAAHRQRARPVAVTAGH